MARNFQFRATAVLAVAVCAMGLLMANSSATTSAPAPTSRDGIGRSLLENGLQAVWEEDHRQLLVAIEVRIKGGLRAEGPYLGTGITHFIEHMLFKGTPTRPPGQIEQEVRRYGGTINAFTSFDTTGITLFVESKHLKDALGMVADIMQHAQFPPAEFEKERQVVISEIQMNQDDPDRRIHKLFWQRHFLEHPYRHPILGHQPLLEALTVEDMARFYASQYQPQNITVACAGDLDGAQMPALIEEIFGGWKRGRIDPLQQMVAEEPPVVSPKVAEVTLPVQSGYALMGFPSVRLSDPDVYPLDVLATILGRGRSSRLYEELIRTRQLAESVSAWNYTPFDPGIFAVQFRAKPEQVDAARAAVLEVLEQVKTSGVTEEELRKAKKLVSADFLFGLQTVEAKAADLAGSLSSTGNPLYSRQYVEAIGRVTAGQVQDAARRYLDPDKMTTAMIRPAAADAGAAAVRPQAGPVAVTKSTLANGATVLIGRDASLPIAAVVVAFRGGVRIEQDTTQGLSNLVAHLLTKGTTKKSASQIAQQVESIGGSLEAFSGRDGFGLVMQVLSEDIGEAVGLTHELITESEFRNEELAIQQRLITSELAAQEDEIFDVGGRLMRQTLFQTHPYRFHPLGVTDTVSKFTRAQCQVFAKQWLVPSNMIIAVFGNVDPAAARKQIDERYGVMPGGDAPWPAAPLPEPALTSVREADKHVDKEQAVIMLGFRGASYKSSDRYAVDVLTAILSGMAGRLFQAVRETHGLSYTLGAVHVPGWDPGYLMVYAATRPEEEEKVVHTLREQLQLAATGPFTDQELLEAKRYLIGNHRMDIQMITGLAKRAAIDELYGLGYDAWQSYEDRINAVTPAMVEAAAKQYLTMDRHVEITVSSTNGHGRQ